MPFHCLPNHPLPCTHAPVGVMSLLIALSFITRRLKAASLLFYVLSRTVQYVCLCALLSRCPFEMGKMGILTFLYPPLIAYTYRLWAYSFIQIGGFVIEITSRDEEECLSDA